MKNLLTLGLLLVLSLHALGQGSVRRADTLLQVLSINPTNIATADRLMYLTAGRNSATDGEALFVDWDRTNALATNTTSRFETVAGIGRWVVRPTLLNLTNVFQFLAGSNMTVSVTSTSVTYSAISGSTGLDWFGMYQDPWDYSFDAVTNWVLYSGADSYNQLEWRILNNTNLVAYLQPHIIKYEQLPYLNTNSLLGRGYAGGNPYDTVESISIGANLLLSSGVLSAVTSSGTNSWQIEADGLLVIEPDLIDSSTINVTPAGSSISFAVQGSSITTNHLASDVVTLLVTDNVGLGTNLIVNGSLRQPAIITNSASVTWTINGDGHIVASAAGGGGSESTTASNLDTQSATNQGWFKALSGSDLQFRNFAVGPNLTLRSNANSVTLDVVLSTNSGTVVSVDGGSSLSLINFADNTRIAGTLTTTNMTYDLVPGTITSNYLAASSVTQDKLSATETPTSTNFLAGDWTYKQVTTNMIPGLVSALQSLQSALTFTNGVTNLSGVVHGNYVPGTNMIFTTNAGRVTVSSTASGSGGSGAGTNLFVNNILSQPAKITNSTTIVWTTNSNGDIVATATNIAGTTTDNVVQRVGYAYFTITNNSTVGDFSYESLGGVITDINCSQCDNDRVGKIDFTFTTLATNYFWTITREGSSAVTTPIGSHTWEDTGLRTSTSLRLFMMDDGGSVTFADVTGYMFRFNLYQTVTVGGSGGDVTGDGNNVLTGSNTFSGATNTFTGTLKLTGYLSLGTNIVPLVNGGTGATNAAGALAALGGQASDSDLAALASAGSTGTGAFVRADAPTLSGNWTFDTITVSNLIGAGGGDVYQASNNVFTASNTFSGPVAIGSIIRTNWIPSHREVYASTEFLFGSGGASTTMFLPWLGNAIVSGTSAALAGTSNHTGIISISSSASANSGYAYITGNSLMLNSPGDFSRYVWRPQNTNAGVREYLGFIDQGASSSAPTDGVYLYRSNNFVFGQAMNNSALTQTLTSTTVESNAWYSGHIQVVSDTVAEFLLFNEAGTLVWSDAVTNGVSMSRSTGHGLTGIYTNTAAAVISNYDFLNFGNLRLITR